MRNPVKTGNARPCGRSKISAEDSMTDFEKTIRREMTRERFDALRDKVYEDAEHFYHCRYGEVASWHVWNRTTEGKIAHVDERRFLAFGSYYDGSIEKWDGEKLPAESRFSSRLTADIVFIGLNMSHDGMQPDWPLFQNARGHKAIVPTFFGTEAEGGYFTDIIKPDSRLLDYVQAGIAGQVMKVIEDDLRNGKGQILRDHIRLFEKELDAIGADKPLLILYGNDVEKIFERAFALRLLEKSRFHAVVKIYHYAYYRYLRQGNDAGNIEAYRSHVREKLRRYITIPEKSLLS